MEEETKMCHKWLPMSGSNISYTCLNCGLVGSIKSSVSSEPQSADKRDCSQVITEYVQEETL
jgi:hypothetical protein